MSILKYEMRAMFEKKQNQTILGPQAMLEDGTLRQIAYLSFLNPYVFPKLDFNIFCIKSLSAKRKIYSCCLAKHDITDCGAVLIFFTNSEELKNTDYENKINLLKVSLMYSCLLYQVDYEMLKINSHQPIKDYFNFTDSIKIQAIITLGNFKKMSANAGDFIRYDEAVKEV